MNYIEDMQDLLTRAKKYRSNIFPPKINKDEHFIADFELNYINCGAEIEIISSGNIYEKCYISKSEIGCIKTITYTKLNRFNKEIETSIDLQIPNDIRNGQDIVLEGKGNYMQGRYSNLIVKVIIQ